MKQSELQRKLAIIRKELYTKNFVDILEDEPVTEPVTEPIKEIEYAAPCHVQSIETPRSKEHVQENLTDSDTLNQILIVVQQQLLIMKMTMIIILFYLLIKIIEKS